jgi:sigma-54 specific flagellar transcriptional regulator A
VLATHFYRSFVEVCGRTDLRGFSSAAMSAIENHAWPGNVRALENAIERSVLLARGPFIEPEDILGAGAGLVAAVESPIVVRSDPRREPTRAPPTRISSAAMAAVSAAAAPHMRGDSRREHEGMPLPLPPLAARFDSSFNQAAIAKPAVLPYASPPERRGSNPAFPRCLPEQGFDLFSAVESYQNNLIRQALARTGGNKNKAAQLLGLNRTTLVEMIRRRGL